MVFRGTLKSDNPKYTNILTNIGGFKFKEINDIFLHKGSQSVAYKLKWFDFHKHLTKLHNMAMNDKSDEELNRYADYHKFNDCLIVIDEASLYFKKYDDALSWFLSYHGHFSVRIIVIAQSPKQIYSEYLSHTEIFYNAQSQSKQIRNNQLRYIHYSDFPFNKDNKFSTSTIKTSQDVYDLYKSGEVDKPKKIIYKFIAIALAALFFILFTSFYFYHKMESKVITDDNKSVSFDKLANNVSFDNKTLICFRCDHKKCWLTDNKYIHREITRSYLKYVLLLNDITLSYYEQNNVIYKIRNNLKGQQKIVLASLTDFFYLIPTNVKDTYFNNLFQLKPQNQNNSLDLSTPFSNQISENEQKGGAP